MDSFGHISYLTGVTAAELRQHLSNWNVIFNGYLTLLKNWENNKTKENGLIPPQPKTVSTSIACNTAFSYLKFLHETGSMVCQDNLKHHMVTNTSHWIYYPGRYSRVLSNLSRYYMRHCNDSRIRLQTHNRHIIPPLMGELWGVYYENFEEIDCVITAPQCMGNWSIWIHKKNKWYNHKIQRKTNQIKTLWILTMCIFHGVYCIYLQYSHVESMSWFSWLCKK